MPKLESLNGVAIIIYKTHTLTYTHTYCRTQEIPKKKISLCLINERDEEISIITVTVESKYKIKKLIIKKFFQK